MVNITIYPWGNANEKKGTDGQWQFQCQHGQHECDGNMVETCLINLAKFDQNIYMDFIIAFEEAIGKKSGDPYGTAATVFNTVQPKNISWTDMQTCMGSSGTEGGKSGNVFEHQMHLWTHEVNHTYTPWITLNGIHSQTEQNSCQSNTLQCTCAVYKGTNSCCTKFREEPMGEICYK
eukprot:51731_1